MPKEENKRTVRQKDADELHATTTPSPTAPPTIVEQSDPSKLKATVTQAAKDRTITGNVGILDSLDARINPAKEDGNLSSIKTNTDNLNITTSAFRDALLGANTKDFSTIQTVLDSIKNTDGIKKITDTVTVTATDLDIRNLAKAQDELYAVLKTDAGVAYDARDRSWTITETIPVTGTFWQATQPVSATDLDIRDLTAVSDNVAAHLYDGAGTALTSTLVGTDQALDINIVQSVALAVTGTFWQATQPVSATDLDIRDLTAVSDNVAAHLYDGAGTALTSTLVGTDQALDINIVQSVALAVTGTFWQATQPVSGTVTVTDMSSVKTAVEKIDNQEDSITYVHVVKGAVDGDIIAEPGAGFFLRIHHLFVNNAGSDWVIFDVEAGISPKFRFCLAGRGGAVAQNFKRPWDLAEREALHYDYIAAGGLSIDIQITVGYETISL